MLKKRLFMRRGVYFAKTQKKENCEMAAFISQKGKKMKIAKRGAFRNLKSGYFIKKRADILRLYLLLFLLFFQPFIVHLLTYTADERRYLVGERLRGDFTIEGVGLEDFQVGFQAAGSYHQAQGGGGYFFEVRYSLEAYRGA